MYTIVESGTNGIEPVKSYEDLEKHHPSKAREPKREYDETDGHLEEIRTNEPGGRRLVKKDFVLLVNGSNKSIDVPCADEISLALKNHKLRDRWSKLIGYHPTEWQAKSSAPKEGLKKSSLEKFTPATMRVTGQ